MKCRSSLVSILTIILAMAVYAPALAVAPGNAGGSNQGMKNNPQEKREERQAQIAENVCQKISDMASREQERLSQRTQNSGDRFKNWQEKIGQRDADLSKIRSDWDANRTAQFAKLEERATTDEQKKAVTDFEATVKEAIATRRAAVDAAIATFRDGVKNLISGRSEDVTSSLTAFSDAVKSAYDTAKSDCSSGKDPATIRTTLRNSLQAARTKFHSDRTNAPKVGGDIQPLIDARRTAVTKAMTDFKAAMEKARVELKKAFPTG